VDLTISMAIAEVGNVDFTFTFNIDETPNEEPCTYPGATVCPDRITFPSAYPSQSFVYGGTLYTLQLLGFANTLGDPYLDYFDSEEGGDNSTLLFGTLTESPIPLIPEPTSLLLLGGGLLGLAGIRRKKK
jgi:hypothetical protein